MSAIRIQIRNRSTGEDWGAWNVLSQDTVLEFKYQMSMRTVSPGGFDFWFGPWILRDKYKLSQYPLRDGDEIQIHDPGVFLMIPLVVHIDSAQLPEPLIVTKVMTIKDVKIMLRRPRPEMFGDWPVCLDIYVEEPSDGMEPLGDTVKVGELGDMHGHSLWAKRSDSGQNSSPRPLHEEKEAAIHSYMNSLRSTSPFSSDLPISGNWLITGLIHPTQLQELKHWRECCTRARAYRDEEIKRERGGKKTGRKEG